MAKYKTVAMSYEALRKECLEAVRQWPGCETIGGIQIIRSNTPVGFSVRVTLYGKADKKIADRAIICVQREKRRHFHLNEKPMRLPRRHQRSVVPKTWSQSVVLTP